MNTPRQHVVITSHEQFLPKVCGKWKKLFWTFEVLEVKFLLISFIEDKNLIMNMKLVESSVQQMNNVGRKCFFDIDVAD